MEELGRSQKQAIAIQNVIVRNPLRRPSWPSFYRGPGLPGSFTDAMEPPEKVDVELIFDSIRQIVETRLGERLMQPSFGSRIFELIGEPLNQVFEVKVKQYLTEAIRRWETRVNLKGVSYSYDHHAVTVTYSLLMIRLGTTAQSTFKIPRPA